MRAGLWGRLGVVTDPNVGGGFLLDDGRPIYGDFFVIVHSFDRRNVFCVPGKGDFVGFQFGPVARNWQRTMMFEVSYSEKSIGFVNYVAGRFDLYMSSLTRENFGSFLFPKKMTKCEK